MDVIIGDYGNGYRPTAEGTLDGRRFFFRMDATGNWEFGVERAGAEPAAWKSFFSSDDELAYHAGGSAGGALYHDAAVPTFLAALAAYLDAVDPTAREALLGSAKTQVETLLGA